MTVDQILTLVGMLGIPSVFSIVVVTWLKNRMDQQDRRAEARKEESKLTMNWMLCAGDAIKEIAVVVKKLGGNGELTAAAAKVEECGQNLNAYLIGQNAQNNH